jgi:hypothetical protein
MFNNINSNSNRDFSSDLRSYVPLEPSIAQSKRVPAEKGIQHARERCVLPRPWSPPPPSPSPP